ncbi:DUF2911 domain-containing protein [Flavobacterium sp. ASW18X]|uniref:DUF2911 domain-containing protein n=1 Tax=Flavobacterium sp. ASW18X TaxID=2572595 RepID=UPI0010AE23A3|nr:DUF2911 domain-containing protein [Flavobacterium sp. ASW18X]TKD61797.1 DUF2911 domain-containing protein [Flavobacterium sp. ASW18X]
MKNLLGLGLLLTVFLATSNLTAQKFSGLDKSPADIASFPTSYKESDKAVRVIYGRPQLKGRDLETLAPTGKVWRTGANEAAEITFYKDVNFGGESVKAGTYALFTIPGADEWTIILNKNLNQWGAYSYDNAADVVRVSGKVSKGSESLEAFSIAFKEVDGGAHLIMGWDTTRVAVPVTM